MSQLKMVQQLQSQLIEVFLKIPDDFDSTTGKKLIKGFSSVIIDAIEHKSPQQLVDDHTREFVFGQVKAPVTANIRPEWWSLETEGKPCFLARAILTLGPANGLCPSHHQRVNQGILCEPHAKNQNMTPIECLLHHFNMEACESGELLDGDQIMRDLVEIFTSTKSVGNPNIDNCDIFFVKGVQYTPVKSTRLDLVYALHLVFYTGLLVCFANPTDFKHYHPLVLITNIFRAQMNFFPDNKHMDKPLSPVQRSNYLLKLGINIFETLRKDFDAKFFLDNADFFPPTSNPTMMPAPRALAYVPGAAALVLDAAHDKQDNDSVFETWYFLFGKRATENDRDLENPDIEAEPLDASILPIYQSAVNNEFDSIDRSRLKVLMTIICPKDILNLNAKNWFGYKTKAQMIAVINAHITTFKDTHNLEGYITELDAAVVQVE